MANPEMGPKDSEEETSQEREQTPEEILEVVKEAIEKGGEVLLTQLKSDGTRITNQASPISIEGNYLTIEADGYGFDVEITKIKEAESVEKLKQEMLDQLPLLREQLTEKQERLKVATDTEEVKVLEEEIEMIEQEITSREELLEE